MAALSELFSQITPTSSVGHPVFHMLVQWDRVHSVFLIYCMQSGSWCYGSTQEEVIKMVTPSRAASADWLVLGLRAELPAPGQVARCSACGWLFGKERGYHEPGEYAYCYDCCQW